MRMFKRPTEPLEFKAKVEPERIKVKKVIKDNKKHKFKNIWKDYKGEFSRAQFGKCGYCEARVIGLQYGDVEHYAPKGEVWELKDDPTTWGEEGESLSNVKGREKIVVSSRGYWWLAYKWENYLLSCAICNQAWKSAYFPVENKPRTIPPEQGIDEQPLLLNPFSRKNPAKHLKMGNLGEVSAFNNSKFGKSTIAVCGLNRPSLREARQWTARRIYRLMQDLSKAQTTPEKDRVLRDIYELGEDDAPFPGLVRGVFESEAGTPWRDLEELMA